MIRSETSADFPAVRRVLEAAFGRADEAGLVEALHAGGYARISLVAEVECRVVGHLLFSALPIETTSRAIEALALAPLAVDPAHQRRGIGSALVVEGLRWCAAEGYRAVIVLGHPEYYARFGFSAERARRLRAPFSGPAFMALELPPISTAGLRGDVRYPPPFGV